MTHHSAYCLEQVRVIDPSRGLDEVRELCVHAGHIASVERLRAQHIPVKRVDGRGLWVIPALLDLHTTLCDPGQEYKERLDQLCATAAAGGYVALATSPATHPVNDHRALTERLRDRAREHNGVQIWPIAAMSEGLEHRQLSEMIELVQAGAVGFSDGERSIERTDFLRRAMEYLKPLKKPLFLRCEDPHLSAGGLMHEGLVSTRLGLKGIPSASEEIAVNRALVLAELTGAHVHLTRLSSAGSIALVRHFKARGVKVTCDVTPHHLTFTDQRVIGYGAEARLNPPLRADSDREALIIGLNDGTIDAITSGHAPQSLLEKEVEFEAAAPGLSSLETTVPALLTLIHQGKLAQDRALDALCIQPARILGIPTPGLKEGAPADFLLLDPTVSRPVRPSTFVIPATSTPFVGMALFGNVRWTVRAGEILWNDGSSPL